MKLVQIHITTKFTMVDKRQSRMGITLYLKSKAGDLKEVTRFAFEVNCAVLP